MRYIFVVFYTYNAVGSVVANTDQDGFLIKENDFDAYGNVVRSVDLLTTNFPSQFGGSANDLLFSTKERDFSTGLDYFGFRYYDAVLGKFLTRDPSGYPDGSNNQVYAGNNPINTIDPLGLENKTFGTNFFGDDWIMPDPVGSFQSGQKNAKTMTDSSKPMLDRVGAGAGMVADGINTVVDSIPIVGKLKKKAAEKLGDVAVAAIEKAPKMIDKAKDLGKAAMDKGKQAVDKVKEGLGNMADKVRDFFGKKKDKDWKPKDGARTEPIDLQEKLTLDEAKGGAGSNWETPLKDKRYDPETGTHTKKKHNHDHGDGTSTEVHYDVDKETGEKSRMKIKDDTNKKTRNKDYKKNEEKK